VAAPIPELAPVTTATPGGEVSVTPGHASDRPPAPRDARSRGGGLPQ
jgi:hypothetical protein